MSDDSKKRWDDTYKLRKMVSPLDFTMKAFAYLQKKPGCSILDIGCGDGRDSLFFAEKGLRVTAIDFSAEAIKRVTTANPAIDAHVMDILAMNFPDASFDAIYAHLSLHYFDDVQTDAVFDVIHRTLKEDGLFFVKCKSITDPLYGKGKEVGKDIFIDEHQRHFFSKDYMAEKLRNFTILELGETIAEYDGKRSCFIEAVAKK